MNFRERLRVQWSWVRARSSDWLFSRSTSEGWLRVLLSILLVNSLHLTAIVLVWVFSSTGQALDAATALRREPLLRFIIELYVPLTTAWVLIFLSSRTAALACLPRLDQIGQEHGLNVERVRRIATTVTPGALALLSTIVAFAWITQEQIATARSIGLLGVVGLSTAVFIVLCRRWWSFSTLGLNDGMEHLRRAHLARVLLAVIVLIGASLCVISQPAGARNIAPLGTLLIGTTAWAAILTIGFISIPLRLPSVRTRLGWLFLVLLLGSSSSDIHRLPEEHRIATESLSHRTYADPEAALYAWLESLPSRATDTGPIPVVLVSADGGGIRAAYWAARLLAVLNIQTRGRLADHIFAYSGMSGGSLGIATFVDAAVTRQLTPEETLKAIDDFYAKDLLSPSLGRLLSVEPLRYYLRLATLQGRDRVFERILADDWRGSSESRSFDDSFLEHLGFPQGNGRAPPIVVFNATMAETGKRLEISNIARTTGGIGTTYFGATFEPSTLPDLNLAQAVHLSARFPGISPPAALYVEMCSAEDRKARGDDCERRSQHWYTIVDGGYNDNSGLRPIFDMVDALDHARQRTSVQEHRTETQERRARLLSRVSLHVIVITNAPDIPFDPYFQRGCPIKPVSDVGAAVSALEGARERRASDSMGAMQSLVLRLRNDLDAEDLERQRKGEPATTSGTEPHRCTGDFRPYVVPAPEAARKASCQRIGDTVFLNSIMYTRRPTRAGLCPDEEERSPLEQLPLGWVLSSVARRQIVDASNEVVESARGNHLAFLDAYWSGKPPSLKRTAPASRRTRPDRELRNSTSGGS